VIRILVRSALLTAIMALLAFFYISLPDVSVLEKTNPKSSALMELRDLENKQKGVRASRRQFWVPYGAISEHLKKAILLSEDARFFGHGGIDLGELRQALKRDWETMSFQRGGSTITMQLAKNLYLNTSKNPLRKVKEIIIAQQLERQLSKRRIFEIYLNVVELGRNIYGVEAASRLYFVKPAADLNILEAATLAALLPSPRNSREKNVLYRRNIVLARLARAGYVSDEELRRAQRLPLFERVEKNQLLMEVH
jgi:monofunctional glycosyltransferase